MNSGGSRPSDKGRGGGGDGGGSGSHADPEISGGQVSKKTFFRPFGLRASVWSKSKEGTGPPGPIRLSPGPALVAQSHSQHTLCCT